MSDWFASAIALIASGCCLLGFGQQCSECKRCVVPVKYDPWFLVATGTSATTCNGHGACTTSGSCSWSASSGSPQTRDHDVLSSLSRFVWLVAQCGWLRRIGV